MLASGPASGAFDPVLDEEASVVVMPGIGVPDSGDPDASDVDGAVGRPRGSAECWRFNCGGVNIVHTAKKLSS
jgi:hypothetical protein